MKIKFDYCDIEYHGNSEKTEKASREIIEVLKNNYLSTAEAKLVFNETLLHLINKPIN